MEQDEKLTIFRTCIPREMKKMNPSKNSVSHGAGTLSSVLPAWLYHDE
ncbi:hypothetical protein [Sporolactobacillus putidus]|uniref:Uncharacterized protein n=1 Tax=Sporolactobacillus putidus TaxID=492735 RepID=A0A917S6G6_9BACL|nr:hypothetical protein [Sporolactobacillus putidus]GGL58439.1 hypothetical protein GCM10007968_23090 [Sporolactobacillus putidus]